MSIDNVILSVPAYFLHCLWKNCSNIPIPTYRKYCKHFHGIFPTSQTCYNFNRETSRIFFIKILEHFRLFLEGEQEDSDSALDVLLSGFSEAARKMFYSSGNLHSSSCVFSGPNLVMFLFIVSVYRITTHYTCRLFERSPGSYILVLVLIINQDILVQFWRENWIWILSISFLVI